MNKSILIKNFLAFFMLFGISHLFSQDCIEFYFEETTIGNLSTVELKVKNFENISTVQLAVAFSPGNLTLDLVEGNTEIGIESFNLNTSTTGYTRLAWSNPITPQTLLDDASLLTFTFTILDINAPAKVQIDPNFTTEITNDVFEEVCYISTPKTINSSKAIILGNITHDQNGDCIKNDNELPLSDWSVIISDGTNTQYRIADIFGNYAIAVDPGSYQITIVPINSTWEPCALSQTVEISEVQEYNASFLAKKSVDEPDLLVNISASPLQICQEKSYTVSYKNNGAQIAENAKIIINFDDLLSYVGDDFPNLAYSNQIATASLGDLAPNEQNSFQITMLLDCDDSEVGHAICVDAIATADNFEPIPISWDGSIINTEVKCDQDTIEFKISNIGIEPTPITLDFIVVEDDVMFGTNQIDLDAQAERILRYHNNGSTYRIIADQEEGFPNGMVSTAYSTSCEDDLTESYNYLSMFSNDDQYSSRDISCMPIVEASLANIISAFPVGYREEHYLEQNRDITYTVYIENTYEDTIANVAILCPIDDNLLTTSLIKGTSSHPYSLTIENENTVRIDLFNIMLMPESDDNIAGTGYVSFTIPQRIDLLPGTEINQFATIVFDNKPPINSNTFSHIIEEEFIEIILDNENILLDNEFVVAPNPSAYKTRIEVPSTIEDISYVLYDMNGKIVNAANTPFNVFYIQRGIIADGIYLLEIRSKNETIGTKKIIFN